MRADMANTNLHTLKLIIRANNATQVAGASELPVFRPPADAISCCSAANLLVT